MTHMKVDERVVELDVVADISDTARSGVDYSPKDGATCPLCKTIRIPVSGSLPWDGDYKVRYHKCNNKKCPISVLGVTVKSIQVNR